MHTCSVGCHDSVSRPGTEFNAGFRGCPEFCVSLSFKFYPEVFALSFLILCLGTPALGAVQFQVLDCCSSSYAYHDLHACGLYNDVKVQLRHVLFPPHVLTPGRFDAQSVLYHGADCSAILQEMATSVMFQHS